MSEEKKELNEDELKEAAGGFQIRQAGTPDADVSGSAYQIKPGKNPGTPTGRRGKLRRAPGQPE